MKIFKNMSRISAVFMALLMCIILPISVSAEGYNYEFDHNSQSIFMFSLDTDDVVYTLNPDEERPMASLTKIMSYIVAYENIPDIEKTVIKVDKSVAEELEGTGSSLAGIYVGEELTAYELLNLMMIPSGNDAALALAHYVDKQAAAGKLQLGVNKPSNSDTSSVVSEESAAAEDSEDSEASSEGEGSKADSEKNGSSSGNESKGEMVKPSTVTGSVFVDLMNEKAEELGCENTHFMNPHGLHDPNHYTTARDMAKIVKYATTLPYFSDITSSTVYTQRPTNKCKEERSVTSTNLMLSEYEADGYYYYMYANGIKTGSLDESGYCITASATYEGYTYVVVALGSPMVDKNGEHIDYHGEMEDARTLFRWAFLNLSMKNITEYGDLLGEVKLQYAWDQDSLQVVAGDSFSTILPDDVSISSIMVDVDLPEAVQAPVKKGDKIGTATFKYANTEIGTVDLIASESVERSEIIRTIETGKAVITSPWFIIIAVAVVLILAVYIIIMILYNVKRKKMRRVKKYRDL